MLRVTRRRAMLTLAAPALIGVRAVAQAPRDWRLSKETEWPDFARRFAGLGVDGALTVLDALRGGRVSANPERVARDYLPGSTFDIPATIIALQTRAARDIGEEKFAAPAPSAPAPGGPALSKACEGEMTLGEAFRHSCLPVYQQLARRIGADAFRDWLTKFDYGNAEAGPDAASFWLDGDLRISAGSQTKFLRQLVTKTLPVSPRAISLTEEIMFVEKIGETAIHGRAGRLDRASPPLAWWIGYAQKGEDLVLVALNMDMPRAELAQEGYGLVREALKAIDML